MRKRNSLNKRNKVDKLDFCVSEKKIRPNISFPHSAIPLINVACVSFVLFHNNFSIIMINNNEPIFGGLFHCFRLPPKSIGRIENNPIEMENCCVVSNKSAFVTTSSYLLIILCLVKDHRSRVDWLGIECWSESRKHWSLMAQSRFVCCQ